MLDQVQIWVTDFEKKDDICYWRQVVYLNHRGGIVLKSWQLQPYVDQCQREKQVPDFRADLPDQYQQLQLHQVRTGLLLEEAKTLKEQGVIDGDVFVLSTLPNEIASARTKNRGIHSSISPK